MERVALAVVVEHIVVQVVDLEWKTHSFNQSLVDRHTEWTLVLEVQEEL